MSRTLGYWRLVPKSKRAPTGGSLGRGPGKSGSIILKAVPKNKAASGHVYLSRGSTRTRVDLKRLYIETDAEIRPRSDCRNIFICPTYLGY
jgi:hypothetical protein